MALCMVRANGKAAFKSSNGVVVRGVRAMNDVRCWRYKDPPFFYSFMCRAGNSQV